MKAGGRGEVCTTRSTQTNRHNNSPLRLSAAVSRIQQSKASSIDFRATTTVRSSPPALSDICSLDSKCYRRRTDVRAALWSDGRIARVPLVSEVCREKVLVSAMMSICVSRMSSASSFRSRLPATGAEYPFLLHHFPLQTDVRCAIVLGLFRACPPACQYSDYEHDIDVQRLMRKAPPSANVRILHDVAECLSLAVWLSCRS